MLEVRLGLPFARPTRRSPGLNGVRLALLSPPLPIRTCHRAGLYATSMRPYATSPAPWRKPRPTSYPGICARKSRCYLHI